MWVETAVREIEELCMTKCFEKAVFKFNQLMHENIEEQQTDYEYPSNDSLMAKWPPHMQVNDYKAIDDELSTEETSDSISDFIT